MAHRVWGSGGKTIVIGTALGTCGAEWWHLAEKLGERCKVVVFDRLGYGKSAPPQSERTPQNIAAELDELLASLNISGSIILAGHSQGGLYAMQYAITYPEKVTSMLLLDPATPYDDEFSRRLTAEQYKKSGVDKTFGLKLGLLFASLKLGFIMKPMLKKMPPFYYYKFSEDAEKYLLESLCRKSSYKAALEEYKFSHTESAVAAVKDAIEKRALAHLPVRLITHSSEVYRKELMEFGSMDSSTAELIENIWQEIMKRTLKLSDNARHVTAPNSGHFIHLTDFDTVLEALRELEAI